MKHLMSCTRFIFIISLFHYFTISLFSEEWTVPADKKVVIAPFAFTPESVQKGADLFLKNCQSCHGNPTKGNFARIDPLPGDPASEKFRALTDGEMFFKISNGRGAMPQFRLILGDEERWDLVSYLRSFHPGYVQPEPVSAQVAGEGERGILSLGFDSLSKLVTVRVYTLKEEKQTPVKGAEVLFYVKRYFGNLSLGEGVRANEQGEISYSFPEGIPGDSAGMVTLVVRLNEAGGYGGALKEIRVPLGAPTEWIALNAPLAMWNINAKAPVWLLLAYSLTVLGVFVTLFYIMLQIRRIFYLGTAADGEPSGKP